MKLQKLLRQNGEMLDKVNTYDIHATREQAGFTKFLLVEEMSELTKEIIKIYIRGKEERWEHFYEELADVILLLDQVVRMADEEVLENQLKFKMQRFMERYGNGRQ